MKIAVISDTHLPRFARRLDEAVRRLSAERPDVILHCGDLTTLEALDAFAALAPVEAVAGNNDGPEIERRYGRRKIVDAGMRIGMLHGDGAHGSPLDHARSAFADETLDAIVFGHSHVPYLGQRGPTWLVNPGSITDKRREERYSYAILERDRDGKLAPRLAYFSAP